MIYQLVFNGLVTGLIAALPALALTLTYGLLKFPNFAIGAMLTFGAYLAWLLNVLLGLHIIAAVALACLLFAGITLLADRAVFRPLRDRGSVTLLVASMGLSFVLENVCRLFFGNDARNFAVEVSRPFRVAGLRVNHEQLIGAAVVLISLLAVYGLLRHTALGRALRAASDNPDLAAVRGIDREATVRCLWGLVGVLTALGGALIGLDRAIDPVMGWNYTITVFAAAILGGLGNPLGAVIGALSIGVIEQLSVLYIPSHYRTGAGFVVIAALLLLRPNGLFGSAEIHK
ncbi:branched-chain amino acid ABC transporter permease [Betaproteobacteria bacterium]|nr:branched-chain amino acid ABC transporter permease [Betaproteobacteria bacterium]GHU29443.1 branched-chain amino acid ABC transporter permease [Betaproteobacteria bacterium]